MELWRRHSQLLSFERYASDSDFIDPHGLGSILYVPMYELSGIRGIMLLREVIDNSQRFEGPREGARVQVHMHASSSRLPCMSQASKLVPKTGI